MPEDKNKPKNTIPEAEELTEQSDDDVKSPRVSVAEIVAKRQAKSAKLQKVAYRPSHKATFIGILVVVAVLMANAGVIWFIIQAQNNNKKVDQESVSLSGEALSALGVTRNDIGASAERLTIGPNTTFNGTLTVAEKASFGSELMLNNKLTGQAASFTKLDAGDTSVSKMNINGDVTASTSNVRQDLNVAGASRLQGAVTIGQILTVSGNLSIGGNAAINGTLSVNNLQVNNLTLNSALTIGGRIISSGSAPNVGSGTGLGSNGTVTISGNDTAGTVVANVGVGGGNGTLVQVAFRNPYPSTPRVVISPVGAPAPGAYVSRSVGGFTVIYSGSLSPGSYVFDYIVMQ